MGGWGPWEDRLSIRYTDRLVDAGIDSSVGSVGDSFDNALAESVIGLYKTEVIRHRGPWCDLETVEFATLEWMDRFNHRRLFIPIGNVPPAEFEQQHYLAQEAPVMGAGVNESALFTNPGRFKSRACSSNSDSSMSMRWV